MGIYLGNIFVSYYGLMIIIGIILGMVLSIFLLKKYKIDLNDFSIIVSLISLGFILGSKILYCILNIKETMILFKNFSKENVILFLNSGFVFYGGLILALVIIIILEKISNINVMKIVNIMFPIFIIAHGFGRIGCGIVGCCYGKQYNGLLSIIYTHSVIAPNNVHLFPTQYIEAFFQIIVGLFFYILILLKGKKNIYLYYYLILYGIFRFIIEFFRGDDRGFITILSTSQAISLVILFIIFFKFVFNKNMRGDSPLKVK